MIFQPHQADMVDTTSVRDTRQDQMSAGIVFSV